MHNKVSLAKEENMTQMTEDTFSEPSAQRSEGSSWGKCCKYKDEGGQI